MNTCTQDEVSKELLELIEEIREKLTQAKRDLRTDSRLCSSCRQELRAELGATLKVLNNPRRTLQLQSQGVEPQAAVLANFAAGDADISVIRRLDEENR